MPRGVPANGQRRRRIDADPVTSLEEETVDALAGSAQDGPDWDDAPAELEDRATTDLPAPAVELTPVELTPEQERIKELEFQLAQVAGKRDVEPEIDLLVTPGGDGNILIHFLEDGFTALGQVWYRGQELEFDPASQSYRDTFDRRGRSWLDMRNDEFGQVERYGHIVFRNGPWPGKSYRDVAKVAFEKLKDGGRVVSPPSEQQLAAAEKAEARRQRSAPKLNAAV